MEIELSDETKTVLEHSIGLPYEQIIELYAPDTDTPIEEITKQRLFVGAKRITVKEEVDKQA